MPFSNISPFHLDEEEEDEGKSTTSAASQLPMAKFLEARTILIFGPIDQKLAQTVSTQLLYLDHISHDPIKIMVNSPGGHVESGDTIFDLIQYVSSPVAIIGTGWVASIAAQIFLSVPKERRFCLPTTRFLIHQPSGGAQGRAGDIAIQAAEIVKMRERIARVIADRTGQTYERVIEDIERDYWMNIEEATAYGILGKVVRSADEVIF